MKRFWFAVAAASFLFATVASSQQQIIPRVFGKPQFSIPVPPQKPLESSENTFRTPSLTPSPDIDYKIQRMAIDESIDYKILDLAPRIHVSLESKNDRQQIRPPLFKYPGIIRKLQDIPSPKSLDINTESNRGYLFDRSSEGLK